MFLYGKKHIAKSAIYSANDYAGQHGRMGTGRLHGLFDKDTQRDVSVAGQLFFIPVRYWPVILALGLVFYFL